MNLETIEYRSLTIDEVLELLRRLPNFDFEIEPFEELELDTPLSQWAKWCKLPQIPLTLSFVRECMQANLSATDWREATEPAEKRTVGHVCEVIARSTKKAVVPPVRILGKECRSAGAFLLVKKLLADTGVNVSGVAPSTHLSCYADKGFPQLRKEISFLCPDLWGRLCASDLRPMILGFSVMVFSLPIVPFDSNWLVILLACGMGLGMLFMWIRTFLMDAGLVKPFDRARFPRMKTFRDLSVAIARVAEKDGVAPSGIKAR